MEDILYGSGSLFVCPLLCQQVNTIVEQGFRMHKYFHIASLLNKPVEEYI